VATMALQGYELVMGMAFQLRRRTLSSLRNKTGEDSYTLQRASLTNSKQKHFENFIFSKLVSHLQCSDEGPHMVVCGAARHAS
jgi:hypothetical protein